VAACWHGGTVAIGETLLGACERGADSHRLVHLAAVHVALEENRAMLDSAARELDLRPRADHAVLARTVRACVERNAVEVIDRVGRALGPEPLAHDPRHTRLVADLQVYIRQHHAERDLELLGVDLLAKHPAWLR
jgi:alkylation response protein AidB-like acyl-CoA dehydrogenase